MRCEEIRIRFADRLTGSPDDEDVREHMRECHECRQDADEVEVLWTTLEDLPSDVPNSHGMRNRFAALLDGYQEGQEGRDGRTGGSQHAVHPLWQLAAGFVLFVAGLLAGRAVPPERSVEIGNDIATVRGELHEVRQMLTLSLLRQEWATERLKGVTWGGQIEDPGGEVVQALLDTLMHDSNINVRLAAVDALARLADEQGVRQGAVDALASADSPLVQVALIDLVVRIAERGSLLTLRRLADDPVADEAVRERAAWGIEQLEAQS